MTTCEEEELVLYWRCYAISCEEEERRWGRERAKSVERSDTGLPRPLRHAAPATTHLLNNISHNTPVIYLHKSVISITCRHTHQLPETYYHTPGITSLNPHICRRIIHRTTHLSYTCDRCARPPASSGTVKARRDTIVTPVLLQNSVRICIAAET